jgi:hypothetical protein
MPPVFAILAAVQAVAGGIQAYGQVQAGKAQKAAIREQAKQEEMAAQSQELQRRQELNRALAANVVALSTAGITGEGSPASLALESARQASLSEMTIDLSERLRRASLERQARSAVQTAGISAASTLLQTGVKAGQLSQTPTDG